MNRKHIFEVFISQKFLKLTHIFFFLGFEKVSKLSFVREKNVNIKTHISEKCPISTSCQFLNSKTRYYFNFSIFLDKLDHINTP